MNWNDLLKALNSLEIDQKVIKGVDREKDFDKVRHKLLKKGIKRITDEKGLETLVEFIEIIGWSQNKAFQFVDSMDFQKARAK